MNKEKIKTGKNRDRQGRPEGGRQVRVPFVEIL